MPHGWVTVSVIQYNVFQPQGIVQAATSSLIPKRLMALSTIWPHLLHRSSGD